MESTLLILEPQCNCAHDVILLGCCELATLRNAMPLLEAASTACCGCMLRDKYGMALEWCLLPIIHWKCGSEAARDEVSCMLDNCRHAFPPQIVALL